VTTLGQDLRYALRTLRRTPGFTAVAVLTLGLGIGATTTIFSVVHAVLMKPLPYRDPERIASIWVDLGVGNQSLPAVSPLDFLDYRQRATQFEGFAAATGPQGSSGALRTPTMAETERVDVTPVTANLFPLFGVDPMLGRHFLPEEETPGGPQVAILSHRLWKRRFADREIVGRQIQLDGVDVTVVGVMPEQFRLLLPAEAFLVTDAEIWRPLRFNYQRAPARNFTSFTVFGRLKPDVTLAQAQAEMDGIARQLRQEHPIHESSDMRIRVIPLRGDIVKHAAPTLYALLGSVVFVLLIACANVAHLLLARASSRQHEMALRSALGARGVRIVRQLATESTLLALGGAIVGVALTGFGLGLLRAINPGNLPRMDDIRIDGNVLMFTAAISLLTAVLFGMAPALRTAGQDLNRTLRASASLSPTRAQLKLRSILVIAEIALALVLLVGAGLLMRSFVRLQQVQPGFDHARVLTFRIALPFAGHPPDVRLAFIKETERRLRALPGVTHVGFAAQIPLTGSGPLRPYAFNEETARNWESETSDLRFVSPEFFAAMGTRLIEGRVFDEHDRGLRRLVIDETLAAQIWPGQSAVGKTIQTQPNGSEGDLYSEVIGAVRPQMWIPILGGIGPSFYGVVRTEGQPASLAPTIRQTIRAVDPSVAVDRVLPMTAYVADGLAQARLSLALMGAFGVVALVLATVGVYGVISYSVGERTREIGIRMALGAQRVRNTILLQGLRLILPSLGIGAAAAWLLSEFIATLLYQTEATDPLTFLAMTVILLSVALAGCYIPARRATTVSPLAAIRSE
jgi:putative ABC transport system permease protein